jgi:hypothetical protein
MEGNANTAITKNTTKISSLKESVDIDGKGSDVDLTHWNVSHPLPRIIKVGPVLSSTKLPLVIILVNKLAV